MNRERAKELLPVIQAFAEGKDIQFALEGYQWTDLHEETAFTFPAEDYEYRIKPEPREFWIIREKGEIDNSGEWYSYRPSLSVHRANEEVIHVREVIE